jgi:hypothetical protein
MINFIINNWALIATALWAVSEVLAQIPNIKSNSIFQLIYNLLIKLRGVYASK